MKVMERSRQKRANRNEDKGLLGTIGYLVEKVSSLQCLALLIRLLTLLVNPWTGDALQACGKSITLSFYLLEYSIHTNTHLHQTAVAG